MGAVWVRHARQTLDVSGVDSLTSAAGSHSTVVPEWPPAFESYVSGWLKVPNLGRYPEISRLNATMGEYIPTFAHSILWWPRAVVGGVCGRMRRAGFLFRATLQVGVPVPVPVLWR